MQVAIEIEFPYVKHLGTPQQEAGKLTLPLLEQMVPLKPATDALGLAWTRQFLKVQSKVKDDPKNWVAKSVVAPSDKQQRKRLCVALRTLQVFLDTLDERRSKDPELLRHFKVHLVDSIYAQVKRVAEELAQPASDNEPHVIVVNRPLEVDDKARALLAKMLLPEDLAYVSDRNEVRIAVEREVETIGGAKKKVLQQVYIHDLSSPAALSLLNQLILDNKGRVLGPRQLYQRGYNKSASFLCLPERIKSTVDAELAVGGVIPLAAVHREKLPAQTIYAPWATPAA